MTFEQMKFAMEQIKVLEKQKKNTDSETLKSILSILKNYFNDIEIKKACNSSLVYYKDNLTQEDFIKDCNNVISALQGLLSRDKHHFVIKNILDDIDKYKKCKSNNSIREAIKSIYHSYSDRIKFNKVIEKLIAEDAKNDHLFDSLASDGFDKTLLDSMIKNLENYANEICLDKPNKEPIKKEKTDTTHITINNSNSNVVNATIDIDIAIKNANEQLENACLSVQQEKEVKEKISELEEIVKSKENKKTKWQKLGGIMKWVAEQGIQVASIIFPLINNAL